MIAACPKCGARYRIEEGRLGPGGARLRCSRCQAVFRVRPPEPRDPGGSPDRVGSERAAPAVQRPPPPGPAPDAPLVLVADPEPEAGRATERALSAWGLRSALVHDGVEAILAIQRMLPRAVVLDAALPKMFGFQVCELVKRNESLRSIHVILIGAIHDRDRYRRPPSETYGADAYVERPDLPEGLAPLLRGFGLLAGTPQPAAPAPRDPQAAEARTPAPRPATHGAPSPPRPEPAATASRPGLDPDEVAKAERLARIVISDIVLYNAEKFREALRSGDIVKAMEEELQEGRSLFRQRIDPKVRESTDFLAEELLRVARKRSAR